MNQYVSSTAYNLNEKLRNNLPLTADEEKIKINMNNALNKLHIFEKSNKTYNILEEEQK